MTPPASNNSATLELILSTVSEVKTAMGVLDGRMRAVEGALITQSVTSTQRLEAAFQRIDEMKIRMDAIQSDLECKVRERVEITGKLAERLDAAEKRVTSLEGIAKAAIWIAGALGLMILTLLWKIFTGEVQIK